MITISLIQINNSFSGQNYLPYSIGCLESYLRKHSSVKEHLEFTPFVYKRQPINEIVSNAKKADIVGFSTYVWNAEISLEAARRIKSKWPDKLVVFGGPQVPDKPEDFLRSNNFIDVVFHNEGERSFTALVDMFPSRNWEQLTGVSFLDESGKFNTSVATPRMRDLSELPSPFLTGCLDKVVAENPNEKWIGLWETNRGCPFQCTFCDWGSATAAKITKFENDRLELELKWMAQREIEYIFVCDANFGIQKRDIDIAKSVAKIKSEMGFPQGFSVQNTKNATERAYLTQKIIADAGLNKGVALSMQSLDPTTLKNIKRDNISLDTYLELARRFTKDKIETYSDLILPLPGETYQSFCCGVDELIRAGQHNRIQFNNLSILPNAEMGDPEYLAKHGMKTQRSEIVNIHGSKAELDDDVPEFQELVIETNTMRLPDWKKARAFSWMASFLHFDKLLQIPIIVALENSKVTFTKIVEEFLYADPAAYPVSSSISRVFFNEATRISNGGVEYIYSGEWLGIYWPADEFAFIKITKENKLEEFYREAKKILMELVDKHDLKVPRQAILDAINVNHLLMSQPFVSDIVKYDVEYNVIEFWNKTKEGELAEINREPWVLEIDRSLRNYENFDDWCREVVWWGNKTGAYLLTGDAGSKEIAGHF